MHCRDGRFGHARKQGNPRSNGEDGFQISLCSLLMSLPVLLTLSLRCALCALLVGLGALCLIASRSPCAATYVTPPAVDNCRPPSSRITVHCASLASSPLVLLLFRPHFTHFGRDLLSGLGNAEPEKGHPPRVGMKPEQRQHERAIRSRTLARVTPSRSVPEFTWLWVPPRDLSPAPRDLFNHSYSTVLGFR